MRILFVTMESPLDPDRGSRIRDRELILRVARHHEVSVLPVLRPGQQLGTDASLLARCEILPPVVVDWSTRAAARRAVSRVRAGRPLASHLSVTDELLARLGRIVGSRKWDVVQIEQSFLAACVTSLAPASIRVLSLHNVGARQYASMAYSARSWRQRAALHLQAWLVKRMELTYLPCFDGVVVVSPAERRVVARWRPSQPIAAVPNGVDVDGRELLGGDGVQGALLFVGNLAYPPNAEAVIDFCRESLPLIRVGMPSAELTIVGPEPPPGVRKLTDDPAVHVVGRVEALEPWYARAQVVIAPLKAGGGTRLKVLEAMALGRCVVSTPVGAEGLDVADGRELLLADPGAPFAARVRDALGDSDLRFALTSRARTFVENEHGWDAAAAGLLDFYARLARPFA